MEFSRQEYWRGLPFPFPGDLPNPGLKSASLAWPVGSLPLLHLESPHICMFNLMKDFHFKILFKGILFIFLVQKYSVCCCLVTKSCLTLCNPTEPGSSVHGIFQARIMSGLPCRSPGDLLNPGMESTAPAASPALQAESLPLSHQGSPTL